MLKCGHLARAAVQGQKALSSHGGSHEGKLAKNFKKPCCKAYLMRVGGLALMTQHLKKHLLNYSADK